MRYSEGNAYKLVGKGGQYLKDLELDYREKIRLTVEKKIKIIEQALEKEDTGTRLWLDLMAEHGKLAGHYVQRVDIKDVTDRTTVEKEELKGINNRIFDADAVALSN